MVIGVCVVKLWLPEPNSLKEKRRILKSIVTRIKNKFNVSVAEIGDNDLWQRTTLGIACVGNATVHVNEVLSNVVNYIDAFGDASITDYTMEIN